MQIIGIGTGGSQIAAELAKHEAYGVLLIDTSFPDSLNNINTVLIEKQETINDYEEKTKLDIENKVRYNNVHVFLFGGGKTTGITLRTLEKIKDKKIIIHYVRPEENFLSNKQKLRERMTSGILQELSRSGVFNKIYLYDTTEVLKGAEVSFLQKKDYVASTIAGMFHMINYIKNTKGLFSNIEEPSEVNRISSFGMVDPETGGEVLHFSLDNVREKCYYFVMSKRALETPGVVEKINNQIQKNSEQASFKIIDSEWHENHVYVEAFTNVVQTTQNKSEK